MRKSEMYTLLGLDLATSISRFQFPKLDSNIFTPKDYSTLRSQLYKASKDNEKLAKQMIHIFLKGKIEEVKAKNNALILAVLFNYKGEQYIAELRLANDLWSLESIHYIGEATPTISMGIVVGSAVGILLLLVLAFMFTLNFMKPTEEVTKGTEVNQAEIAEQNVSSEADSFEKDSIEGDTIDKEVIPLEELEKLARKMDLVLIREEEYQNLLEQQDLLEQQNLVEQKNISKEETIVNQNIGADASTVTVPLGEESLSPKVKITVQYKMSAKEVAQQIVDSDVKVAQDTEELLNFFIQQNIQYKIRTGVHEMPINATYEDIVRILTSRK